LLPAPHPFSPAYISIARAAGCIEIIEDAAIDKATSMRKDFFIYPTLDYYHDK
jgi:hypothetical protein